MQAAKPLNYGIEATPILTIWGPEDTGTLLFVWVTACALSRSIAGGAGSYFSCAGEALGFPKGEAGAPTGVWGADVKLD